MWVSIIGPSYKEAIPPMKKQKSFYVDHQIEWSSFVDILWNWKVGDFAWNSLVESYPKSSGFEIDFEVNIQAFKNRHLVDSININICSDKSSGALSVQVETTTPRINNQRPSKGGSFWIMITHLSSCDDIALERVNELMTIISKFLKLSKLFPNFVHIAPNCFFNHSKS